MISIYFRIENIVGQGANACYQPMIFLAIFSYAFSFSVVKSRDCVVKG